MYEIFETLGLFEIEIKWISNYPTLIWRRFTKLQPQSPTATSLEKSSSDFSPSATKTKQKLSTPPNALPRKLPWENCTVQYFYDRMNCGAPINDQLNHSSIQVLFAVPRSTWACLDVYLMGAIWAQEERHPLPAKNNDIPVSQLQTYADNRSACCEQSPKAI